MIAHIDLEKENHLHSTFEQLMIGKAGNYMYNTKIYCIIQVYHAFVKMNNNFC